jgi:hypothetical protein
LGIDINTILGSGGGSGGSGQGQNGIAGLAYGAGAGGAGNSTSFSATTGAAGYQGVIIIVYFPIKPTVILLKTTGAGTWTVPSDWNSLNNTIEAIGGGGGTGNASRGGGGGGAYTKLTNFSLTPGATVNIFVGAGGAGATTYGSGQDTWLNKTTNAAPSSSTDGLLAKAGTTPISLATTAASGNGTTATITFAAQSIAPVVGTLVTVAGVTPTGYNGNYTVTASSTTSISYANATTGSQTVAGTVVFASGGSALACVPSSGAFSGGSGGVFTISGSWPGGGGAAGPSGAGGNGGNGYSAANAGGGGGGGNGGSAGGTGTASAAGTGGSGGGASGGAGGTGGTSGSINGLIGKTGTGGGGGGGEYIGSNSYAASGGSGNLWSATATTSQSVSITTASPAVFTVTTSPPQGTPVIFSTTGSLPTGLFVGQIYYVINPPSGSVTPSATTFNVSLTLDGAAINTTAGGSGTYTATFTSIAGPGGGAGGGSSTSGGSTRAGNGGFYGGGGGNPNANTNYGAGAQGVIAITYTPITGNFLMAMS